MRKIQYLSELPEGALAGNWQIVTVLGCVIADGLDLSPLFLSARSTGTMARQIDLVDAMWHALSEFCLDNVYLDPEILAKSLGCYTLSSGVFLSRAIIRSTHSSSFHEIKD